VPRRLCVPGGIAILKVPSSFLNNTDSTAKLLVASRADFAGAVRLPSNEDVIVFKRKMHDIPFNETNAPLWTVDPDNNNFYFKMFPDHVVDAPSELLNTITDIPVDISKGKFTYDYNREFIGKETIAGIPVRRTIYLCYQRRCSLVR